VTVSSPLLGKRRLASCLAPPPRVAPPLRVGSALALVLAALGSSHLALGAEPLPMEEAPLDDLSLTALLDTEVVSATMNEESMADAAAVIDVITSEELQSRGYRSVGEALESVVGLDVTYDHYQYNLGVRGISGGVRGWSRTVKVMVDGQPVSFRTTGENFLGVELVPIGVVDRIEIVRGPGSVLFGANAFLGVVNIITKQGYATEGSSVTAGYGVGPRLRNPWGQGIFAQDFGNWSLLAAVQGESLEREGYKLVPLPGRTHPRDSERSQAAPMISGSTYLRLSYDDEHLGSLTLDANLQRLDRSFEFADWGVMAHDNRVQLYNGYARLRYATEFGRDFTLNASVAFNRGVRGAQDRLNTAPGLDTHIERDMGYVGYDVTSVATYNIGKVGTLLAGVDGSWDVQTLQAHYTVADDGTRVLNPPAGTQTGDKSFINTGLFAQAALHPFEDLAVPVLSDVGVTAGARIDHQNIYGDNWNWRGGLVYERAQRYYVKGLAGTSFRAPAPSQLYSNYLEPGGAIGNPQLNPERARTFELAAGATLLPGLTLRADAYSTLVEERVQLQRPSLSSPVANPFPTNSSPITSQGVESQVDYWEGPLRLYGNYALQNSHFPEQDILSLERETVQVQTDYPTHLVKAGATVTLESLHLRTHLDGRYSSSRPGNRDNNAQVNGQDALVQRYTLPSYLLLDLTITSVGVELWKGHETHLLGQVRNLLGSHYVAPGYSGFDIPGLLRSYYFSLQQDL
jgi:outer membrane receptor for ferrienterochelin and colicin